MDHNLYAAEDADRAIIVSEALLVQLARDSRVLHAYDEWCEGAIQPYAALPPDAPSSHRSSAYAFGAWRNARADLRALRRLVRRDLQLPFPWVAPSLLKLFQASWIGLDVGIRKPPIDVTREPHETELEFLKRLRRLDGPPSGRRRSKRGGDHLVRDVQWFYLVRVRQPPRKISDLAADYAREAGRSTDPRSVIQNGIKRAERLLTEVRLY